MSDSRSASPPGGTPHGDAGGLEPAVVIPCYDAPPVALANLLRGLAELGLGRGGLVLVDDGSESRSGRRLGELARVHAATLVRHPRNRGKGAALRSGFRAVLAGSVASAASLRGVLTLDADGQHRPEDAHGLLDAARASPEALWVGRREHPERVAGFAGEETSGDPAGRGVVPNDAAATPAPAPTHPSAAPVPLRSRLGHALSRMALARLLGIELADAQCGLRLYPASLLPALTRLRYEGYAFETAALALALRLGVPLREHPIAAVYEAGNPTSHFRPLRDTLRIGAAALALRARRARLG